VGRTRTVIWRTLRCGLSPFQEQSPGGEILKYLLDTNVASQRPKPQPDPRVSAWLQQVHEEDTFLSAITIQEARFGLENMALGTKRDVVQRWLENYVLINFRERILPVDVAVADECGRLMLRAKQLKHTPSLADALIAATAIVHGLSVATLNIKHFKPLGVKLVQF
jgi:predicted nucleic acid-binding protein